MKDINVIGENIRRVRKMHKLTQAQFGEIIGKSQSTVYGYENGSVIPSFEILNTVSQMFHVSLGHMMGLESPLLSSKSLSELLSMYENEIDEV